MRIMVKETSLLLAGLMLCTLGVQTGSALGDATRLIQQLLKIVQQLIHGRTWISTTRYLSKTSQTN